MKHLAAIVLLSAVVSSAVSAQSTNVYKWTDSSGVVHYADQPPPNENASHMRLNAKAAVPSSQAATPGQPQPAAGSDAKLASAETAARTRNCENAKANASTVAGSAMVVNSSDPTSARRMDQDELEAARNNAKRDVAAWCDGGAK
ncbi:DUF4124 domain-containing protein [Luteibacter aegosomaticola]|uniref:DUF4124 domain-containing protein n=1 Tax=Luteibacter aegosomaticola TaxID=2911538 RepID=UPI001FF7D92B|nr:DUF4124 domain-containing protein [Luteibacter aegosomaticola]UPG88885.1 DUF4124 domain-containing protein [Luteibacter aegosomaticola]